MTQTLDGGGSILNREGETAYDVRWAWQDGPLEPGLTAVLRVKNEARNLPWVLPPLLDAVDRIVLVDNQSTDGTAEVARTWADRVGATDRVDIAHYPFDVSRCGAEHLETPADSVHSLTHFYNWSFARAQTSHSLKWDGDMVLTAEGAATVAALAWQIEREEVIVAFPYVPLYIESDRVGYLDFHLVNVEPWIYPMGADFVYVKGFDWEVRQAPSDVPKLVLPQGLCFELKWLDEDEFSHWSSPDDFHPQRNSRKLREHEVFTALSEQRFEDLSRVERVEAPEGTHIIDHVARSWLPHAPRPLGRPTTPDQSERP